MNNKNTNINFGESVYISELGKNILIGSPLSYKSKGNVYFY